MSADDFKKGMDLRRKMHGPEGAEPRLEQASDFMRPVEEWVTEQCFGAAWHRPALDHRTRSMLTLAMLVSVGQDFHFKHHVKGALANGVSKEEIREIFMHAIIYCGLPQAIKAFIAAEQALKELE